MSRLIRFSIAVLMVTAAAFVLNPRPGIAGSAVEIDRNVDKALVDLYAQSSEAKALAKRAKGILVFPKIIKAGLIIGARKSVGVIENHSRKMRP